MKKATAKKLETIRTKLAANFIGREKEIDTILACIVGDANVLLLGPPGTAKSALAEAVTASVGGKVFKRLLDKFSPPETVFGPMDIMGMKNGKYERKTEAYLPDATVGFLDEIFKANASILNALLTIMNERVFDNGTEREKTPVRCIIGASNELPESSELNAFDDRFIIRHWVDKVRDRKGRHAITTGSVSAKPINDQFTVSEFNDLCVSFESVLVRSEIVSLLLDIEDRLFEEMGIDWSNRKVKKIYSLLKALAVVRGQDEVDEEILADFLPDMGWTKPEERQAVTKIINSIVAPDIAVALELSDAARQAIRSMSSFSRTDASYNQQLQKSKAVIGGIITAFQSDVKSKNAKTIDSAKKILNCYSDCMGLVMQEITGSKEISEKVLEQNELFTNLKGWINE